MSRLWVTELSYSRSEKPIFSDLNFQITSGQVLVLTGHNGAGKTSLLKTLAGLIQPDRGQVFFQSPQDAMPRVLSADDQAWLGDRVAIKAQWSALQNLQFLSDLRSGTQSDPLNALDELGLFSVRHRLVKTFSQGMKKRLALAALSLTTRPVWLLDEPQAALDRQGIACFEKILDRHLSHHGLAVMASHHDFNHPNARLLPMGYAQ